MRMVVDLATVTEVRGARWIEIQESKYLCVWVPDGPSLYILWLTVNCFPGLRCTARSVLYSFSHRMETGACEMYIGFIDPRYKINYYGGC